MDHAERGPAHLLDTMVSYIDDDIYGFDLDEALAAVSPERREYALRYRQERDRRLSLAAYRLLHHALLLEYGITQLPVLLHDASGRPWLQGHPGICCSMSHCDAAVAVAVSDSPVGIDIETTAHYSAQVARRVMSDDEMRHILASPRPQVAFTRLWTMKESLFKLTGDDGGGDIAHLLTTTSADKCRFHTVIHPRYVCTTCLTREE